MERIKIKLPEHFAFSINIHIRITDLNYGGHVGNDTFLSLLHEARHMYLQQMGYSEMSFENAGLIMADAGIEYKKELVQGNNVKISVKADGFDKYGFDLFYIIEIMTDQKPVLATKAKTGMLCFDYTTRKLVPLSEIAKAKLQGY